MVTPILYTYSTLAVLNIIAVTGPVGPSGIGSAGIGQGQLDALSGFTTGVSGSLANQIAASSAGVSTLNAKSGALNLAGDSVNIGISLSGQTIYVSGSGIASATNLALTGTTLYTLVTGSSGSSSILITQTSGVLNNQITGLSGYVNSVSGALQTQITGNAGTQLKVTGSAALGVASISGLGGITVILSGGQILISGATGFISGMVITGVQQSQLDILSGVVVATSGALNANSLDVTANVLGLTGADITAGGAVTFAYGKTGDNAGGIWYYNPTSNSTINSGTIRGAAGGTGRWFRAQPDDVVNVKWFGASGDNVNDDTNAIQAAMNAAPIGGKVYFPVGKYLVTSTLSAFNKPLKLAGPRAKFSFGAQITRSGDVTALGASGTANNFSYMDISDIEFRSFASGYSNAPMVQFKYLGPSYYENFSINGNSDQSKGLSLDAVQDSTFVQCFFRGIGNTGNGSLHCETANGLLNVNDNRFFGCHFEWTAAAMPTFVYTEGGTSGGQNNSMTFVGCKFESTAPSIASPVRIINGSRWRFIGCRFTHYEGALSGAFWVDTINDLGLDVDVLNSSAPVAGLGSFYGCNGLDIKAHGQFIGAPYIDYSSRRVTRNIGRDVEYLSVP